MLACASDHGVTGSRAARRAALAAMTTHFPVLVSVSPDGRRLLHRTVRRADFEFAVVDRASGRVLATDRSADLQVSFGWRADGGAVAFFADTGGDQRYELFVLDVARGRRAALRAPPTAAPVLRWAPRGTRLLVLQASPRSAARRLAVVETAGPGATPAVVVPDVALYAGFTWSPDGDRVATVRRGDEAAVTIARLDGRRARLPVAARGAEVRELNWSPDARSILATVRGARDEFFRLVEVDVATGTVRTVAAPPADVTGPLYLPDGSGLKYQVNVDGESRAVLADRDGGRAHEFGSAAGGVAVVGFSTGGDSAFLVRTSPGAPPTFYAMHLATGGGVRLDIAPPAPATSAIPVERVTLRAGDGLALPTYVWRAVRRTDREPAALVSVHGGPASQAGPVWDRGTDYLVRAGIDVVVVNYRGSTGYGASFERAPGDDSARVSDVLSARDYARDVLGVAPARIVLFGRSYGALLVARAGARDPGGIGGVLLSSIAGGSAPRARGAPARRGVPRVVAFHSANDRLQAPAHARSQVVALLGEDALLPPRGSFRVFEHEGHNLHRAESWAEVYAAAAMLALRGAPAAARPRRGGGVARR